MMLIKIYKGGIKIAKRYKKGNKRKKNKNSNTYFKREYQLNKMISKFIKEYYSLSYPPTDDEYESMNEQRLQIKKMFDLQDNEVWKQSRKRKSVYYQQLEAFKYYYVAWKHLTYYIYLDQRFGVPRHHCTTLSFFKRTNLDCKGAVYQL